MTRKIAILGGGAAALTTAFDLTDPRHGADVEVTVYQLGHRLGGKAASHRREVEGAGAVIEEHGLHIYLGFYENAFDVLERAYVAIQRPDGAPLQTIEDAFKPFPHVSLMESHRGEWIPWALPDMQDTGVPWDDEYLNPWRFLVRLVRGLVSAVFDISIVPTRFDTLFKPLRSKLTELVELIGEATFEFGAANAGELAEALEDAQSLWKRVPTRSLAPFAGMWKLRLADVFADFALAAAIGLLRDGAAASRSWETIDGEDFRAWLGRHGAAQTTTNSPLVNGLYDIAFAPPGMGAAGACLSGLLRIGLPYEGAIFWKMQAGMGETVVAPLYQALRKRGVKFEFFHRARALHVDATGTRIAKIEFGVQATPKKATYNPLIAVDRSGRIHTPPPSTDATFATWPDSDLNAKDLLPAWPADPHYDQLNEGDALRLANRPDLEVDGNAWVAHEKTRVLRAGIDFDEVVLGISVGALPPLCSELAGVNPRFRDMLTHARTIRTQAAQLWFRDGFEQLGWEHGEVVLDAFEKPFDTWADMSPLLAREGWAPTQPRGLAYVCSHMIDGPTPTDFDTDLGTVRANLDRWLDHSSFHLWPKTRTSLGTFDRAKLLRQGTFDGTYVTTSKNASDRYVLTPPGSTQYRLAPHDSGFTNLVLAGDWTKTPLNVGCVEAATMSGRLAARAIIGKPDFIFGVDSEPQTMLPYRDRIGSVVLRPPYAIEQADVAFFGVRASAHALQTILDRDLNSLAPAGHRYETLEGLLVFACASAGQTSSAFGPDVAAGRFPEKDFGVWIPLVEMRGGAPTGVAIYQVMLFVDNDPAITTGREALGYHKQLGELSGPPWGSTGAYEVKAIARPVGAANPSRSVPIFRVTPPPAGVGSAATPENLAAALEASLESAVLPTAVGAFLAAVAAPGGLPSLRVPQVCFRQLPDVTRPSLAAFSELVEVPAAVTAFRRAEILPPHEVTPYENASHPLRSAFGLPPTGSIPTLFAIRVDYDFTIEVGRALGRRSLP